MYTLLDSQLKNKLYYIKHCWGVNEQNGIVNSVPADDWTAEWAIFARNDILGMCPHLYITSRAPHFVWGLGRKRQSKAKNRETESIIFSLADLSLGILPENDARAN